jgi:hypothetical protein
MNMKFLFFSLMLFGSNLTFLLLDVWIDLLEWFSTECSRWYSLPARLNFEAFKFFWLLFFKIPLEGVLSPFRLETSLKSGSFRLSFGVLLRSRILGGFQLTFGGYGLYFGVNEFAETGCCC